MKKSLRHCNPNNYTSLKHVAVKYICVIRGIKHHTEGKGAFRTVVVPLKHRTDNYFHDIFRLVGALTKLRDTDMNFDWGKITWQMVEDAWLLGELLK